MPCSSKKKVHKENSTQNSSSVFYPLIYSDAHWSKPDTRHLFFGASPSMSGVWLRAEEFFRIEWRCSSVRRLLCDVLFIFIKENSWSYRYVLPNIESIWAAWVRSWGIVSGMNRENCAAAQSYLTWACHNTGVQSAPIGGWLVRFPRQLQTDYWAVQTYISRLQSRQIAG